MSIFHSMNTTASALTANRLRMDIVSSNMANADTTRAKQVDGEWEPYRRKMVVHGAKGRTIFNFIAKGNGDYRNTRDWKWCEGNKHIGR